MENKIVMEFPQENDTDLYLNVFGHSITEPLHKAGPAVKTFYLIHFVLEGEGDFYVKGAHYHLKRVRASSLNLTPPPHIYRTNTIHGVMYGSVSRADAPTTR